MNMKKMTMVMKMRRRVGNTAYHILMILLSLTMIYPFVWAILSSFKTPEQLYNGSPLDMVPQPFTLDNYDRLFEVLPFGRFIINSIFLSIAIPLCMIGLYYGLCAYQAEFPGKKRVVSGLCCHDDDSRPCDNDSKLQLGDKPEPDKYIYRIVPFQCVYGFQRL